MLNKEGSSIIFKVFGMTRPVIELWTIDEHTYYYDNGPVIYMENELIYILKKALIFIEK